MPERDLTSSLMVMLTYECQLRCSYCEVVKAARSMPWPTLRSAIDLLLTSSSARVQLRHFGGEPLMRLDLIHAALDYSREASERAGKSVRHMITTNGLLLDGAALRRLAGAPVEIMFSFDGTRRSHDRRRASARGGSGYARVLANLMRLRDSGLDYFVNAVVDPSDLEGAAEDLETLTGLGMRRIQVCYRVAVDWDAPQRAGLLALLERFARRPGVELLNLRNGCEPVMLSDEILVDVDGTLYLDGAVFLERSFPRLRGALRLGRVDSGGTMAALVRNKEQVLDLFQRSYPRGSSERRVFINNLGVGVEVDRVMSRAAGRGR